jgi:parallel beta-helix repeat protein
MKGSRTSKARSCFNPSFLHGLLAAICLAGLLGPIAPAQAQEPPPVPVRYDASTRTIYVGDDYDPSDPAQAPFVGYPSHPDAPKTSITIPQIAAALGDPTLLRNLGSGVWLLQADMVISATARLEATSATISWLRLDSTPGRSPALTRLVAPGGHVRIQGIRLTSWNALTNDVDTNTIDGRSYLLASVGGRIDIINAEVSHLGFDSGEPSGLAWRKRGTDGNPLTGATGSIINSDIHDNYFGQYSYEAYGLVLTHSQFHHNVMYGIDPHDYSTGFEVAYNRVYSNGKHGIIFSRGCTLNSIHDNEVYGNAEHGIMLDRGSDRNTISNNLVYNNRDGIAIFQSTNNLIQNNTLRDNERGVRINATFDPMDEFDGLSTDNTVLGNTITHNSQYGIYLYERADRNRIENNQVAENAVSGLRIKTGRNTIVRNDIRLNGHGISISGLEPYTPGAVSPVGDPGRGNIVQGNVIEDNDSIGVQIKAGVETLVGVDAEAPDPINGNLIRTNGTHGVSLDAGSVQNVVQANAIHGNGQDGVQIKGADSYRNRITRNSITGNGQKGIDLQDGANQGILPPIVISPASSPTITGTASPGATVEVYRDPGGQGAAYKGATTADAQGNWQLIPPAGDSPSEGAATALAIDALGNTSAFSGSSVAASYATLGAGRYGELTAYINGPGTSVTLSDIQRALKGISPTVSLLENQGNGVWQANVSLFINHGVTLTLSPETVTWLKLRSQSTDILPTSVQTATPNYDSFVTLRTYSGVVQIRDVKITSWDPVAGTFDLDPSNGRSYVLAKYAARLDIQNSELSYLGFAGGEGYGVSWRDINDADFPDVLLTRVTGEVTNSIFSHNYYGAYTFQASNMVFRGNQFHHNIGYGLDPHDFSHHFLIEDNQAYANGNHGFIISRGCNNFTLRNNRSYDNRYSLDTQDRLAHGFMIDPGSPNSQYPQRPSYQNLLENNQAWGNDGYGLRTVGSISNTIRSNTFTGNAQGITLEQGSTGNVVSSNVISGNQLYGIYLFGGSDGNTIVGNTIMHSGRHGIYIKTGQNTVAQNTISYNGSWDNDVRTGSGIAFLQETVATAIQDLRIPGTISSLTADPDLIGPAALAGPVTGNVVRQNTVTHNLDDGIELKSAIGTLVEDNVVEANLANGIYLASGTSRSLIQRNTVRSNWGYGLKANGADVTGNRWTENLVYDNGLGGMVTTSDANNGIRPPTLVQQGQSISGTTRPGAVVEIYSDTDYQGLYFEGRTTADALGAFKFVASQSWRAPNLNAMATDAQGNSSGFTVNRGEPCVYLIGACVYLPLIRR